LRNRSGSWLIDAAGSSYSKPLHFAVRRIVARGFWASRPSSGEPPVEL
jgi:hypothetical protein